MIVLILKRKKSPNALAFGLEKLERLMGVEPTCRAWEARILPMNYSRKKIAQEILRLVRVTGLEPARLPNGT